MPARIPSVWCADLLVSVDPCANGTACTAEGPAYPLGNEVWDAGAGAIRLAGAAGEVLVFQLVLEKSAGRLESLRLEGLPGVALTLGANIPVPVAPLPPGPGLSAAPFGTAAEASPGTVMLDDPVVPLEAARCGESLAAVVRAAPRVPGRRRQTLCVELQIPRGAPAGELRGALVLRCGGGERRCPLLLRVYGFELPEGDACTADINNYSRVPFAGGLEADTAGDAYIRTKNAYFRMAREHRACFHLLPYGHSGGIVPGYAPRLEGRGRNRRVADWTPFDRQWGALLDGGAYAGSRCGAAPVEYLYTPVNLNWPAYFENYGRPGFKVEYQNVLREMAAHFAERGWTRTKFEVFFNHKVRWKYFPWDMDEIYYDRDNAATVEFARWASEAVRDFPQVKFVNRIDSSWIFNRSARTEIGDAVQLWVVNRSSHSHCPDEVKLLRDQGQQVWQYGGPGSIGFPDRLDTLRWPWVTWGRETDGFCLWNGVGFGSWELVGRGGDHIMYPGERFGIEGPLASLRLKTLLRGMQDHAYLTLLGEKTGSRAAADAIVGATVGTAGREGWYQREETAEVDGATIQTASRTARPWNTAPRAAFAAARAGLAEAVEQA